MKRNIVSLAALLLAATALGACQRSASVASNGEVHVDVTDQGFVPAVVKVPAGRPFTLVMTRRTDQTCATEVAFAGLDRKYVLPLNQPVRILLPARPAGTLSYRCGMDMLGGRITIE